MLVSNWCGSRRTTHDSFYSRMADHGCGVIQCEHQSLERVNAENPLAVALSV